MKYFKELYVGFSKDRYDDTEDQRLLGFATPKDDTKAFENRKYTVDNWSDKDIESKVIENTPQYGFKILDSFKRHKGNKGFRLFDPRGFELEISVENMVEILLECTVSHGLFTDKMVWMRNGANNWLVSENNAGYKERNNVVKTGSATKVNQIYVHPGNDTLFYRYVGKFNYHLISYVVDTDYVYKGGSWYSRDREVIKTDTKFEVKRPTDKVCIYQEFSLVEGELTAVNTHIRKSPMKNLIETSNAPSIVTDYDLTPFKEILSYTLGGLREMPSKGIITTLNRGYFSTGYVIFENLESSKQRNYTLKECLETLRPYKEYHGNRYRDILEGRGDIYEKLVDGNFTENNIILKKDIDTNSE